MHTGGQRTALPVERVDLGVPGALEVCPFTLAAFYITAAFQILLKLATGESSSTESTKEVNRANDSQHCNADLSANEETPQS